ncbi:MAG: 6-phosphogluconolactonase [Rhizobacter sp.]|nr:6-phosphogluconolactonase [Chlorobiales bacterium]
MSVTALLALPKSVELAQVEAELRSLTASASHENETKEIAVIKAAALNLLIYTETAAMSQQQTEQLKELSQDFPCRAFVIFDDASHPDEEITATINSYYTKLSGGRQVCLEEVFLHAQSEARRRISHTVLGLLSPDLPVFLLSHCKTPWDNSTVPRLFRFATRMIIDSAEFDTPKQSLPAFAAMLNEHKREVAFSDLNWTRLSGWRALMAQFFDAPYAKEMLPSINRVTIKYNALYPSLGYTQALMLLGWLCVKLGWQFLGKMSEPKKGKYFLEMMQGSRRIECELLPEQGGTETIGIHSFCLYAVGREEHENLCIYKTETDDCLETVANAKGQTYTRTAQMHEHSKSWLIGQELGIMGRDETFEKVFELAARLSQGLSSTIASLQAASHVIAEDNDELFQRAAEIFLHAAKEAIAERGLFKVALSGGSTPKGLFTLLATDAYRERINWTRTFLFWGDERCVPPTDERSNYRMANESLISLVPIPPSNIRRIYAEDADKEAVAKLYTAKIRELFKLRETELPVFDLILLGMGSDGHTASLFPGTAALRETEKIVAANYIDKLKEFRITLTYPAINNAMNVLFMVAGADKAEVLNDVLHGPYQPEVYPAQAVQPTFGRLTWLITKDAAARLKS